jgi:inosine/xanthosine triphosphatase
MEIAIGSNNPVKINAVKKAFSTFFNEFKVNSVVSSSGVTDMPMSFDEMFQGAKNRAGYALKETRADFAVGLEGGCEEFNGEYFLEGIVVILDKNGKIGMGKSSAVLLPKIFVEEIKKGKELGVIVDEFSHDKNSKQKGGAISFLTEGKMGREEEFANATTLALIPFINKLYDKTFIDGKL